MTLVAMSNQDRPNPVFEKRTIDTGDPLTIRKADACREQVAEARDGETFQSHGSMKTKGRGGRRGWNCIVVLCYAQDLGLAGKTGSGTENRNGPKGASHFRYLTPFSSERLNPNF
jgi:hypothetical protein